MIINLNKVKSIIDNDALTAYYIAQEIGSNRQNIHNYKNGKQELSNMRVDLALKLQNLYNQLEEKNMYKLIVTENGDVQSKAYFKTFEDVKQHLIVTDYFSWINDNEPEKELPNFADVEDVRDLETIFEEYDYSWWTMSLEVNEV